MTQEAWGDILGYEGLYKISNHGRVYSLISNTVLKNIMSKRGYYHVTLCKNRTKKNLRINRLVAMRFIPNTCNKPEVNHIDENKANNHVGNLEWCTTKENRNHGTCVQRCIANRNFDSRKKPIIQYEKSGKFVRELESIWQAEIQLGFNIGNISECCHGRRNTAHGFVWKFKNTKEKIV